MVDNYVELLQLILLQGCALLVVDESQCYPSFLKYFKFTNRHNGQTSCYHPVTNIDSLCLKLTHIDNYTIAFPNMYCTVSNSYYALRN